MGMSASQARLIQLTARMSDLELEGQQINQQRLNLANQSSALSEQALRIPVPTAPSTYDFMHDVYSGKDSSGNKVTAVLNDAGKLDVGMLQAQAPSLESRGTAAATVPYDPVTAPVASGSSSITVSYAPEVEKTGYEFNGQKITKEAYDKLQDGKAPTKDSEGKEIPEAQQNKAAYKGSYTSFTYYVAEGTKTETVSGGKAPTQKYAHAHGINPEAGASPLDINYSWTFDGVVKEGDANAAGAQTSGYSESEINNMVSANPPYYTSEGDGAKKLTRDDFDSATGKLKEGVQLYQKSEYERIGGNDAYEFDEIKGSDLYKDASNKAAIDDLIQRVKNYATNANGGNPNIDLKDWRIVAIDQGNGQFGFQAVKLNRDDHGNLNGEAETFATTTVEDAFVSTEFDPDSMDVTTGTASIKVGNKTVILTKSSELDQDAYKAAEAEYKNKKAEYDVAQENFNQQTKKLQQVDKQLELKLKRLDTERNSLNTEIDAVKKVIQDNSDKSFKTFSG